MILSEIKELLQAEFLTSVPEGDMHFETVCSTDLMSDVLAFSQSGTLLITGLVDRAAIRTAQIANVKAIIFVRGKRPNIDVISLAEEKKIPLLSTKLFMFDTCGRLYEKGLRNYLNAKQ